MLGWGLLVLLGAVRTCFGTVVRMVAVRECLHRQPCLVSLLLGSCCAMLVQRIGIAVARRVRESIFFEEMSGMWVRGGSERRVAGFEATVEWGSRVLFLVLMA